MTKKPLWKKRGLEKINGKYESQNGDQVYLSPIGITRGMYICGESGSGKSNCFNKPCQILSKKEISHDR